MILPSDAWPAGGGPSAATTGARTCFSFARSLLTWIGGHVAAALASAPPAARGKRLPSHLPYDVAPAITPALQVHSVWQVSRLSSRFSGSFFCAPPPQTPQVSEEEAVRRIEAIREPYKLEILAGITQKHPGDPITIYHVGSAAVDSQDKNVWWDLCAGPHVQHTGELDPQAIQLESVAGGRRPAETTVPS